MVLATGALRVGQRERDEAVERLKMAFTDGRLDRQELDERLHVAMVARTRNDLDSILVDLNVPVPVPPETVRDPVSVRRQRPLVWRFCDALSDVFCCGSPARR